MHTSFAHPVLLVHPDREEAEYLRARLQVEGVAQPIVIFPDTLAAKDYLNAATIADPTDNRYLPCVVLLDEKLGEAEIRALMPWLRAQRRLCSIRVAALSSSGSLGAEAVADTWGADEALTTKDQIHDLAGFIARVCD